MICPECDGYEQHKENCPSSVTKSIPFETKKVGEFRMLVIPSKEVEDEPVKPTIFRNDYGAVISERAWNQLQEKKRRAKEGGYVLDEYSQ